MTDKVPDFQDRLLTCCDCGEDFTFEAGEQFFFYSKGLAEPKRCKDCRTRRRLLIAPNRGER